MGNHESQESTSGNSNPDLPCKHHISATPLSAIKEHSIAPPSSMTLTDQIPMPIHLTNLSPLTPEDSYPCTPDGSITSFPVITLPKPKLNQNDQSSFANVSNGITGAHIATRISKIAAKFWFKNMEHLDMKQRLEIGCSIFFAAFTANSEIKHIMDAQFTKRDKSMASKALKYLDMIGWLLRNLLRDDIDLYTLMTNLGTFHKNMGVKMQHLDVMLQAMHPTFSYYFPQQYDISVKYAMDQIFTVVSQIMTGEDLSFSTYMNNITKTFLQKDHDIDFLKDLGICLDSAIGKEYFYQYLKQNFCDETVLFLQTISEFKAQNTVFERFKIARDIMRTSVDPDAHFTINISYDARKDAVRAMEELERQYREKQKMNINSEFFVEIEKEIYRLISQNHWVIFKHNMKVLQSKSFGFSM